MSLDLALSVIPFHVAEKALHSFCRLLIGVGNIRNFYHNLRKGTEGHRREGRDKNISYSIIYYVTYYYTIPC